MSRFTMNKYEVIVTTRDGTPYETVGDGDRHVIAQSGSFFALHFISNVIFLENPKWQCQFEIDVDGVTFPAVRILRGGQGRLAFDQFQFKDSGTIRITCVDVEFLLNDVQGVYEGYEDGAYVDLVFHYGPPGPGAGLRQQQQEEECDLTGSSPHWHLIQV